MLLVVDSYKIESLPVSWHAEDYATRFCQMGYCAVLYIASENIGNQQTDIFLSEQRKKNFYAVS